MNPDFYVHFYKTEFILPKHDKHLTTSEPLYLYVICVGSTELYELGEILTYVIPLDFIVVVGILCYMSYTGNKYIIYGCN